MSFTFAANEYASLIACAIQYGWHVMPVVEWITNPEMKREKVIVIRHDIDRRANKAPFYAAILRDAGVRGSFYFRKTKSGFPERWILQTAELGQEVGYHYETLAQCRGNRDKAIAMLTDDIREFEKIAPCQTICAHGSPLSSHDNSSLLREGGWEVFSIRGEATYSLVDQDFAYLTDTGGKWNSGGGTTNIRDHLPGSREMPAPESKREWENLLANDEGRVYLTIHPERWGISILDYAYCRWFDATTNIVKRVLRAVR